MTSTKPKPGKVVEPPKDVLEKHMEKMLKKISAHKSAGPFLHPVCAIFLAMFANHVSDNFVVVH